MQVLALKIVPRLGQVAQVARQDPDGARPIDRLLPRHSDIPVGIALEERESLDDDRDGSVKSGARLVQGVPLLAGLRVQRIARKRQANPSAAVDENGVASAHQTSS